MGAFKEMNIDLDEVIARGSRLLKASQDIDLKTMPTKDRIEICIADLITNTSKADTLISVMLLLSMLEDIKKNGDNNGPA